MGCWPKEFLSVKVSQRKVKIRGHKHSNPAYQIPDAAHRRTESTVCIQALNSLPSRQELLHRLHEWKCAANKELAG